MDLVSWLGGSGRHAIGGGSAAAPGASAGWGWVTLALSAAVAAGYVAIAFNWYFQRKLDAGARGGRRGSANAAAARLLGLVVCSTACGYAFYATDMAWRVWRLYDAVLLLLAWRTWAFALRMRGIGLVDERLAEVDGLERSAQKFREIAELLPHMVWTATADGTVDFSNREWAAYAGAGRTWLDAAHPLERRAAVDWWAGVVARREPAAREVRLHGAAGAAAYRTFLVKVTPIVHGDSVKWLGACADIEDQKLLAAEKELQARQKTFFLNALSHDLRAPLNNVVLNAHLLKMSAAASAPLDPADAEVADLVVENAQAAGDLVTKLLEYAKAGAAGDQNVLEPVDVSALLRQVARRFQPTAQRRGLTLTLDLPADADAADLMVTDRLKLERVVSNLVDNGLKYTERGGVTIAWWADARDDREEGFSVRVTDTGIGVPPQTVPRLFDEFYQVNNHERDRSKGFGMGLAICRSLARQLGGDVRLVPAAPAAGRGERGQAGRGDDDAFGSCFEVAVAAVRVSRRGRPDRAAGDYADPEEAGLCHV
jgi:signal transduction histidine kinase